MNKKPWICNILFLFPHLNWSIKTWKLGKIKKIYKIPYFTNHDHVIILAAKFNDGFGILYWLKNYIWNFENISYILRHQHQSIWFMGNLNDIHQWLMVKSVLFNFGGNLFFHKIVKTNFCSISNDCAIFFLYKQNVNVQWLFFPIQEFLNSEKCHFIKGIN